MYNENPNIMKPNDINSYLEINPDDKSVLLFSAYYEDFKKWENNVEQARMEAKNIREKIDKLSIEYTRIGFVKNIWRKISNNSLNKKDILKTIKILENTERHLAEYIDNLINNPPEEWKYRLAALGSIFSSKWATPNLG